MCPAARLITTPRDDDLGLRRITNQTGLSINVLPNGCVFTIEHQHEEGRIMVNQMLGSSLQGGIARLYFRAHAPDRLVAQAVGPGAKVGFGTVDDRFAWEGETGGMRHRAVLWLHPRHNVWLWRLEVVNVREVDITCDAILVQDVGLAPRGFLTTNEAYASQYIDHHVAGHPDLGPVVMSRQNLSQGGRYPWVAHGCLEGAASFATDAMQLFGPAYRDADEVLGGDLPGERLQHEVACPMIQSRIVTLKPNAQATWTFFGLYEPDHPEASSAADLVRIETARRALHDLSRGDVPLSARIRSVLQDAAPLVADPLDEDTLAERFPERMHEERSDGRLLSFFVPDGAANRHVVLREKERIVPRRHGALLRSGQGVLPDETTLCATCWMHGVFAAQLTIGNTSFHKLFRSRAIPTTSPAQAGCACCWMRATAGGCLRCPRSSRSASATAAGSTALPAARSRCMRSHRVTIQRCSGASPSRGRPAASSSSAISSSVSASSSTPAASRSTRGANEFAFRPDPDGLWGQRYPNAVYFLVTSTPDAVEAIGGDELLYVDGQARGGAYAAMRTRPTTELCFAVVGSMTHPEEAGRLAAKYERGVNAEAMLVPATRYWRKVTRGLRIIGGSPEVAALDTIFPWLAHDAMVHLTVPHGLEQYTGAAWGTRDVCQGPVEFLLSLEHDEPVKEILRIVFAEQYEIAWRLAAMVHARAVRSDPGQSQPWRRHRVAAEGALRLHRSD